MDSAIRGKKITCPGARDKLNFRQDKYIFSPNVRRTSKKLYASLFQLDKDKLFSNRTSKNFEVLVIFKDFFTPGANGFAHHISWYQDSTKLANDYHHTSVPFHKESYVYVYVQDLRQV